MTRETLERKIKELLDDVVDLGGMVEQATISAVESLRTRDIKASRSIYANDQQINDKRFDIETQCLVIIASQQPMATDLRILAAILDISSELERMGDYAKGIARININMGEDLLLKPLVDLPRMAEITADMLHRAIQAFVNSDDKQALAIPKEDDQIDDLFNQVSRELISFMISDPETIDRANHLQWAAHNLERMADRVTNICERTIFVVTGELIELDVSDDELNNLSN
ncbi:MAG: phosphate signaling complex protein PhoU [Chloroflexi bacterium]|nr:phosphate signaling complex protein PhoU [Chloroflexota bacterium]